MTDDETDEQRADREATERDHARGDHTYCGVTCEVEMPTEHLRNFVIAKGYPGTKGALDELLRRARAEGAASASVTPTGDQTSPEKRLQAITEAAGTTTGGGDPRQAAYDAVFAYIRNRPRDFLPATVVDRNAMIWHAVHAALDAMGVPAAEKPKGT